MSLFIRIFYQSCIIKINVPILTRHMPVHIINLTKYDLRLNELKELFILSHSALSRLIQKMAESPKPLITREKCSDDRRGISIGLTEYVLNK